MKLKLKHCILVSLSIISLEVIVPPTTAVLANEVNSPSTEEVSTEQPTVVVTENELFINGESINEEQLDELLETIEYIEEPNESGFRFAAAAGVYFVPGVGQVALAATGAVILGGVSIKAGHWAYKKISSYLNSAKFKVAKRYAIDHQILRTNGSVDLGKFKDKHGNTPLTKNSGTFKNGRYTIDKDETNHGGRKWKLKKGNKRIGSLDAKGNIISK